MRRTVECSSDADDVMNTAFAKILSRQEKERDYLQFHPEEQIIMEQQLKHGNHLSPMNKECSIESRSANVLPDQPLRERSLCPYHHVLNYNPKRIPASITEVVCTCDSIGSLSMPMRCEPMYFHVRVLLYSEDCKKFVETTEKISLACVPVFVNQIEAGAPITDIKGESAEVKT
ncbi:unnamed protein product [Auanema sp. JU1783]|nr:unnamed protein product [Auanema sp. JU1783]